MPQPRSGPHGERANPGEDLFSFAGSQAIEQLGPLAARMRPRSLSEVVGQQHLVGPNGPLFAMVARRQASSCIFWGPPGTGKTTLARLVAAESGSEFEAVAATSAGVGEVRQAISRAKAVLGQHGRRSVIFVDEIHRFSRPQQEVLLPAVEDGTVVLVGATTENPFFALTGALLSRTALFRLNPLTADDTIGLMRRALKVENASGDPHALELLASLASGDARAALGGLELALSTARAQLASGDLSHDDPVHLSLEHVERARVDQSLRGGADEHYDVVSALIKSVRGSDADAGLYWLSRMLNSGEDPRFITRRLVILASEDVGMADSAALSVAQAAASALEFVGLPEGALILAHAVIYLACAPKSNSVTVALQKAQLDAGTRPEPVPMHLRDAHYQSASKLGHGVGYKYPHDFENAWVAQAYRPPSLQDHRYYQPADRAAEKEVARRMDELGTKWLQK